MQPTFRSAALTFRDFCCWCGCSRAEPRFLGNQPEGGVWPEEENEAFSCVGHCLGRVVRFADGNGPPCGSKHLVPRKEDLYDFTMLCWCARKMKCCLISMWSSADPEHLTQLLPLCLQILISVWATLMNRSPLISLLPLTEAVLVVPRLQPTSVAVAFSFFSVSVSAKTKAATWPWGRIPGVEGSRGAALRAAASWSTEVISCVGDVTRRR